MAVVVVDAATERCPFPGLAAHAAVRTRMEPERSLKWPLDRSDFAPGETLVYSCLADRQIPSGQSAALTCRRDGTWDAPVPRCGGWRTYSLYGVYRIHHSRFICI